MKRRIVMCVRTPTGVGAVLMVVVAVATLAVSAWGSCDAPPAGLVGWWPGDGNANDIIGTNNGTLQGGATATAVGVVGQAFSFNGTNAYVQIPNNAALQPTNLTIEAWVLFSSLDSAGSGSSPAGDQYIVFKQNSQTWNFEGFDLSKTRVTGGDVFRFLITSATAQSVEIHSTTMVATGVWYHVAGVRGSNFTQIYVNGQLERQTNVSFAQNYGSLPLYFGTSGESYWDHKLKGLLDEVSLYDRALSSNELAAIYAAGAAGKCKAVNGLTITTQPQSQGVAVGGNAVFSVAALGAAPLSYQWQFGGAAITDATGASLSLTNVQPANGGNYTVVVTNSTASATSAVAVLTVLVLPAITAQPQSLTNVTGTTATFSATATGSAPLGYQWRLNGVSLTNGGRIGGATTDTLTISEVQPTDAGEYTMVVSNAAGVVASAVAVLSVTGPPVITAQPASQSVMVGSNTSFSVTVSGTPPLSYQWLVNGASLADGSQFSSTASATLSIADAQTTNAGSYSVVVTNMAGSVTSAVASLTVIVPGGCLPPPADLVGWWPGDGNADDIIGGNDGTLNGGATATAVGEVGEAFSFDGTNGYVSIPDSPVFHPTNLTVECWVRFASLNSAVSGGAPQGGQFMVFKQNSQTWGFEGFDLSKIREASGDVFRFIVTSATAQTAELHATTLVTTGVWYHVAGVRGANYTQIYVNGNLESQTNVSFPQNYGTLPLYFGTSGESYWDCKLKGELDEVSLYNRALSSNEVAAIYSAGAAGKCKPVNEVTIITQPQSQSVAAGSEAAFTVAASGTAPLSYQWQFNGASLSGATSASLTLADVQPANAGSYTVVVTNAAGSATSAAAVLTVSGSPAIVTQPASQSVAAGANVSFSVAASGTAPLSYQWQFNGAKLSGATATSLALADVQPANAGSYTVVVTNSSGSATSAAAVLTVLPGAGTVIINGAVTYQVIDGFGVDANSGSWTNNELQPVIDALIDQAGMTLFLAEFVGNCNWEAANANPGSSLTNWAYFDNVYSGPSFQQLWGMMAYLNQRGITNGVMPKFTGPTALWMGGESLTPGYENAYAEMIASAVIYARNTQNLQFTVVSPLNEPDISDNTGVHLSGASQYVTVVDDLGHQLDANGMSDVRFSGPDLAYTTTSWMATMMDDSYLMSKLAHFGLHSYLNLSPDATGVSSFIQQSAYPNTHFWMTEFSVWCQSCQSTGGDDTWANAQGIASFLLNLLAEGASAGLVYEAWDGEWDGYNSSTGQNAAGVWDFWGLFAVDDINAVNKTYTARKQFYTVSQITAFVRPGAQRIEVSGASTPLTLLAFYNTNNGQFTLTGVNTTSSASSLSCALESLPAIPSLGFYYTSSTTNLCYGGSVAVNSGAFSVVVPASCVFTLTYTNPVAPLATGPPPPASGAPYFLTPLGQKGNLSLTLVGASGGACLIEASSNLVDWFEVTNVTLLGGTATISQPMTTAARFYRATLLR